jgi:hypothetical protein
MRILVATIILAAACGGPKTKKESSLVDEGSGAPATCCCKTTPMTSEDAKPVFGMQNRMECSTQQGECVDDVQCNGSQQPGGSKDTGVPAPPPLAPSTSSPM